MPEEKVSRYDRDEVKRLEREIELTGDNRFVGLPAADAGPRQRCAVGGWPLADSVAKGCRPGNCSLRPLPLTAYDPQRANNEYGGLKLWAAAPQEAAPDDDPGNLWQRVGPSATAPDWVMRVAVDDTFVAAVEDRLGMGHGAWDMISGEKICRAVIEQAAALIREAGSERERELEGKLRRSYELAHIFAKKIAMLTLSEKSYDEYSSALKELTEASRLLGGESK